MLQNILELSTAINAVSIALVDAGIPLIGIVCAVPIAIIDTKNISYDYQTYQLQKKKKNRNTIIENDSTLYIIDPSEDDLNNSTSWHAIAYELKEGQIARLLLCESSGKFTKIQLFKVLEHASTACVQIYENFSKAVSSKLENDFVWKN